MNKLSSLTFHESYGTLPVYTLRLVKRNNVSPMDWDMLTDHYEDDWNAINEAIASYSKNNNFNVFLWEQDTYAF